MDRSVFPDEHVKLANKNKVNWHKVVRMNEQTFEHEYNKFLLGLPNELVLKNKKDKAPAHGRAPRHILNNRYDERGMAATAAAAERVSGTSAAAYSASSSASCPDVSGVRSGLGLRP